MFNCYISNCVIWIYRLDIDRWIKYVIPHSRTAPNGREGACAVAIGASIFMHGGSIGKKHGADLWKLSRTCDGIAWTLIDLETGFIPSPRSRHTGWECDGKMWIFGGVGLPFTGFLDEHGDYWRDDITGNTVDVGYDNQLHCYDPTKKTWTNVESRGAIPSPRADHSVTDAKGNMWLYGGLSIRAGTYCCMDDLFELNLDSFIWTQIQTNGLLKPIGRSGHFFTAVGDTCNQIILHGGYSKKDVMLEYISLSYEESVWILDLNSVSWRQQKGATGAERSGHTGTIGSDNNVIIFGGSRLQYGEWQKETTYSDVTCISLLPMRLQKLSLQAVHKHRAVLKNRWYEVHPYWQTQLVDICNLGKPHKMNTSTVCRIPTFDLVFKIYHTLFTLLLCLGVLLLYYCELDTNFKANT